ncbi:MAG TPA: efflux transporter outer membrane subunit [Caulobacteraceae bacterium]|jgi:multidrug efflux system outer membrane protein|nr:efflux transporter outer membrane subunit [Caulobacteraceae bacterium]
MRVRSPLSVLALAALMLGGCATLAPKYVRPPAPVPATWPHGAAYPPATASNTTAADERWRDVFTDPKLQAVIAQALANNRDLRVAILNVEQSRAQYRIQRSELFPTVKGNASVTELHEPAAAVGVPGAGSVDERLYSLNASISSYELDLFGRVRSLTKAALEQYLATDEARRAAQITLVSETATDYVTLAADRERLSVAQATLTSQEASLKITRDRFNAGEASELDVRQAETTVDQARSDIAADTTLAAQDLNALNLVVGATVSDDLLPASLEGPAPIRADLPAGISSAILLKRPDVLQAEHQLKADNADIGAARAAFFPTLSLTAQGGVESTQLSKLFAAGSGAWQFIPNLSVPIFDFGANRARLKSAKVQRDIAVAQYDKAIQTAFREVADALARRGTIDAQLAAQQANVAASDRALFLTKARYDRGIDPYLNYLIAERALYAAQMTDIAAKQARYANLVTLYQALGGGVQ